jgi:signal transduction histidine kinase
MPESDAVLAFDRFHRGDGALAAASSGQVRPGERGSPGSDGIGAASSGLGLSIVQAIAAAHGGHAELASAPGRGTTVRAWIPVKAGRPGG